ncbi:MAG: RDD family protein [Verrucomicrobia bacterium]|nr:RDD family protein [Verrucomicrobiota bacterium]
MLNFWRRFFARITDYGVFYLTGVLLSVILPFEFDESFYFLYALVTPLLWIPIEAYLIAKWGTTPGKRLFRMYIPNLSFQQSLHRACFLRSRPGTIRTETIGRWRYMVALSLALVCGSSLFVGKNISEVAVRYEEGVMASSWIEYASDDGKFTVQFPKEPEVATQTVPVPNSNQTLNLNEVKAKQSDHTFSVSYLELPKRWRIFSASTLLKGAMKVVAGHMPQAQLLDKKSVKHKSYPAVEFRMKEGEKEIDGRLILVGSRVYKVMVTHPQGLEGEEQHKAFLNSFDLQSAK